MVSLSNRDEPPLQRCGGPLPAKNARSATRAGLWSGPTLLLFGGPTRRVFADDATQSAVTGPGQVSSL